MLHVRIKLDGGSMPRQATPYAAAYDLYVPSDVVLRPGRQVVDLGFVMELPRGYAATIQPRSGFSINGMEVRHCVKGSEGKWSWVDNSCRIDADVIRGLVDEDYRDHVGVIINVHELFDASRERYVLLAGTRIAQMQIIKTPVVNVVEVDEVDMSKNRGGGYGHTGR